MPPQRKRVSRRRFSQAVLTGCIGLFRGGRIRSAPANAGRNPVRLGGPAFVKGNDPDAWAEAHRTLGYGAATCPVGLDASDAEIERYRQAAERANLVIAEVGAWSNPISRNEDERRQAIEKCRNGLALAERIAARCCVNISGSRGKQWDGPDPENLAKPTFDLVVETTRSIIDAVKPRRTFFTLEPMPWAYPDSPDSYLRLLKAVDRKSFAVHLDPVNMICSPQRYFQNREFLRECFMKLGPHIRSCHAKDILLQTKLTTHLDEVGAGLGVLDYGTYLDELSRLPEPPCLIIEHLKTPEEYRQAADYIRSVGEKTGVSFIPGDPIVP